MANILFKCRSCGGQLLQADDCAGQQVTCVHCDDRLTVPQVVVLFACPHVHCGLVMRIDRSLQGDGLWCPSCKKAIMLPTQRADVMLCLCKRCGKIAEFPVVDVGKILPCPKCDELIRVPVVNTATQAMPGNSAPDPVSLLKDGGISMITDDKVVPVLVVDDNPADQKLMAAHLQQIRFWKRPVELDFAKDGAEAVAKLRQKGFALVILDWNLPVLGQGDVLRYLRKHGGQIPVVVTSGVEPRHITDALATLKGTFLSKDTMGQEAFHVAICVALSLVNLNVSDLFEART